MRKKIVVEIRSAWSASSMVVPGLEAQVSCPPSLNAQKTKGENGSPPCAWKSVSPIDYTKRLRCSTSFFRMLPRSLSGYFPSDSSSMQKSFW